MDQTINIRPFNRGCDFINSNKKCFSEVRDLARKITLANKFDSADFTCEACGAPVFVDYAQYWFYGRWKSGRANVECEYCATVYAVPLEEFHNLRG